MHYTALYNTKICSAEHQGALWVVFIHERPAKTPASTLQTPANARKVRQMVILMSSCCFPIRGTVFFFPFFCYIDGLVENMKIHTQTMRLCHQYAWVKARILGWWGAMGAPKELEEPQPVDMIFFKQPWFPATRHEQHVSFWKDIYGIIVKGGSSFFLVFVFFLVLAILGHYWMGTAALNIQICPVTWEFSKSSIEKIKTAHWVGCRALENGYQ